MFSKKKNLYFDNFSYIFFPEFNNPTFSVYINGKPNRDYKKIPFIKSFRVSGDNFRLYGGFRRLSSVEYPFNRFFDYNYILLGTMYKRNSSTMLVGTNISFDPVSKSADLFGIHLFSLDKDDVCMNIDISKNSKSIFGANVVVSSIVSYKPKKYVDDVFFGVKVSNNTNYNSERVNISTLLSLHWERLKFMVVSNLIFTYDISLIPELYYKFYLPITDRIGLNVTSSHLINANPDLHTETVMHLTDSMRLLCGISVEFDNSIKYKKGYIGYEYTLVKNSDYDMGFGIYLEQYENYQLYPKIGINFRIV